MRTIARNSRSGSLRGSLPCARRAGMTLLEITLLLGVSGVVLYKVASALSLASTSVRTQANVSLIEENARIVLDRIAYQLMGAEVETVTIPDVPGMHSKDVRYRVSLGVEDGEIVYSAPEEVRHFEGASSYEVQWGENVDTPEEQRITWTRWAEPFLGGELQNGVDDNDNGLIDEEGLTFVIDGNLIQVLLTLSLVGENGERWTMTKTREVLIRN